MNPTNPIPRLSAVGGGILFALFSLGLAANSLAGLIVHYTFDGDTGVSAQGDATYQPFNFPPAVSGSPEAFFRVEEE